MFRYFAPQRLRLSEALEPQIVSGSVWNRSQEATRYTLTLGLSEHDMRTYMYTYIYICRDGSMRA